MVEGAAWAALDGLAHDPDLSADFAALCDCGGRFAGTPGEVAARRLLLDRGAAATGRPGQRLPVAYGGWRTVRAVLGLPAGGSAPCHPLVRTVATPPGGLVAELVDLGRGTPEAFAERAAEIRGRIVLVRHEYMFATGHLHRRRKYQWACERGASGFLIAAPQPGAGLVTGSAGRDGPDGIPAAGLSFETAALLDTRDGARPVVRLDIATEEMPAETETLLFDLPGGGDERVFLTAHLDGHDLCESAIDNASGCAVALAVAKALGPYVAGFRRGLSLAFFSVEEWALTGSRRYLEGLSPAERDRIALDVNLDSVGGTTRLTALTSDFPELDGFVRRAAERCGLALGVYRPLMSNSDHANFARLGIPALRLVAGFDELGSNMRHVLTASDTRDKVTAAELGNAARLAAALAIAACTAPDAEIRTLRRR
jgi:hypothetical protein